MCGIAGCFGVKDIEKVDRMLNVLPHRGPDDRDIHSFDRTVLGHTRLSIVDVRKGRQPILADEGRSGIVCNGEVYNFRTLRKQLKDKYTFQTDSDTEVILHLYREMGPRCVEKLDGMFAFAAVKGDEYMLSRDPIGIKPLYYAFQDGHLYFTSELGAMEHAGLEDIHEFPAGHYYTPAEGFVRYYEIPAIQDHTLIDVDEACYKIRSTFIRAVKKRLLADRDIHVGSFCSGGLDSSLVAAIAAEEIPNLHTFVVGMRNAYRVESDDLKASRIAAAHIGSRHHELHFTEDDYFEALPIVIRKLESYDPSLVRCAVPCYFTCKLAAEYVTVVLTGEGADELFAGYHYMKHYPMNRVNPEARRCIGNLHNINLQRADRMGMLFSLELRVPFLDVELIDLAMKIPPELKIQTVKEPDERIEKWILRKAFEGSGYLPEDILWRYKVQYTQGAGCESLGEKLAEAEVTDTEFERLQAEHPNASLNTKEAAYYFKIFRRYHPQDSILDSVGIWTGFDFDEERESVSGTMDGDRKHFRPVLEEDDTDSAKSRLK